MIFTSGATSSLKTVAESFKFSEGSAFYYLTDSHTSVLGMREVVSTENIIPITKENLLNNILIKTSGLVTFPAQCNFNGYKFPLNLIAKFHENSEVYVCLDAASYLSTNRLDLQAVKPDYVTLSFYKIFGYPTGLGALIVSKRGEEKLEKKYYGGGTVKIALTRTNWHVKRDSFYERFEDGTVSFLSIIALQTCFQFMENLLGIDFTMRVSRHVFNLAKYLYENLKNLKHHNGKPVVIFHHDTMFDDLETQGGIVNFSLRHADGLYVGFAEFASIAVIHNIILRTGCFCNPGSCQTHLGLSNDDLMRQFNSGHICGDENDLIDGAPTGTIRVSFGYMTTQENIEKLVQVISDCYIEKIVGSLKILKTVSTKNQPKLKSIRIFPIKSCGQMTINSSWTVTNKGLKFDREWMIIDGLNGTSMTQKNETRMCMIKPFIDEKKMMLRLEFPNFPSIEIPLVCEGSNTREAKICETKVCGDRIQGIDCGEEVAQWLSRCLSIDGLRLIKQIDNVKRRYGAITLSNQAQFLLISEPSVQWLINEVELWEGSGANNLDSIVNRFRGNLIIDNVEPLDENNFKKLLIGQAEFEVQGACTRCHMICIDQSNGEKTTEPLRTIGKVFKGKMKFGIYLKNSNDKEITLTCGDDIIVS